MKVGDIIKFKGSWATGDRFGMLVSYGNFSEDWWDILDCDGKMVVWPESQLEVISEMD